MNSPILLFFLCLLPGILSALLLYQQYAFRTGTQAKLRGIHEKLKEILDTDSHTGKASQYLRKTKRDPRHRQSGAYSDFYGK